MFFLFIFLGAVLELGFLAGHVQVFFLLRFTQEHLVDAVFFTGLHLAQAVAQLNDRDHTILVTNGGQLALHALVAFLLRVEVELDAGQGAVGHFVLVGEFVLSVI